MVLPKKAPRRNNSFGTNRSLQDDNNNVKDDYCGGSTSSLPSTNPKCRWFTARSSRPKRRSSLGGMLFPSSELSHSSSVDASVTVTLGIHKNDRSIFPLPECPRDHTKKTSKGNKNFNSTKDDTGSTAEDSDDANESYEYITGDDCFGVRFDLSRTQYRDDTVRSMDCEMELYDCWYNRMATTNFKMDQRQAADELFEANENDNVENTHAQRILHWRQTLHAAFLESHERPQDRQQEESSSLFLEGTEESSSSESESESVLSCLEQLYADEDAAALLIGLEFDVLARLSGRPNKKARAILDLLQQAGHDDCEATTAVASQIAILSAPTLRFSRTVALAQAKVVQHMQQQQH